MFEQNDLVEQKNKSCRKSSKKFLEFKKKLGLDPDVVTCDEQDMLSALQVAFEGINNKRFQVDLNYQHLLILTTKPYY